MKMMRQQGVSLVEVLVTVAILAIGLLGLAALQALALRNNNSSLMRTHAVYLAYDILDRMRVNPSGNYSIGLNDGPPNSSDCGQAAANCSSSSMVQYDLAQWKCAVGSYDGHVSCQGYTLQGYLPEGMGSVSNNGDLVTVTIEWVDDRSGNTTSYTLSAEL